MGAARRSGGRALLLALLVNAVLFGAVYARYTPRFDTNDDVGMMLQAAGVSVGEEPSEHLLFSSILIGKALQALYRLHAGFAWYPAYLAGSLFAAHVALLFAALRLQRARAALVFYLLYFALAGVHLLLNLQFTTVACLAGAAGFALVLSLAAEPDDPSAPRPTGPASLAAAGLMALGGLIRWDAFVLSAALCLPLLTMRAAAGPRRAVLNAGLVLVLALAVTFGLHHLGRFLRGRAPGGREFARFNPLLCRVVDDQVLESLPPEQRAAALAAAGWSTNDYRVLQSYCFVDEGVYNVASFERLLAGVPPVKRGLPLAQAWPSLRSILRRDVPRNCLLVVGLALCWLAGGPRRGAHALVSLLTVFGLLGYLIYARRPPPPRVYLPMFAFLAWLPLLRFGEPPSPAPPAEGRARLRVWLGLVLALLTLYQARRMRASYRWQSAENRENHRWVAATLARLNPRADQLYVVWGASFPWPYLRPCADLRLLAGFNTFQFGDGQQTPQARATLARFGVTNLFAALPERDNLFLLLREPEYLELYGRYMVEHHATPVRPEVVFTSDFFNVYAIRPAPGIDAAGGDLE